MRTVIHILIVAIGLLLVAELIPGIEVESFLVAIVAAFVLGVLNFFVRPLLILLTLPITLLTLGLFTFVINALLFLLAASILDGFFVAGFFPALFGSIVLSIISTAGRMLLD